MAKRRATVDGCLSVLYTSWYCCSREVCCTLILALGVKSLSLTAVSCTGNLSLEGYGVDSCVNSGQDCGAAAADAFCNYLGGYNHHLCVTLHETPILSTCQAGEASRQLPHTDMCPLLTVQHPSPAALVLHLHIYPCPVTIVQDLTLLPMTISSRKLSQQTALPIL